MVTVDRLNLEGFGRFQHREFSLSPGLNLIYGGNEAGKSTVHSFIEAMLFGFWKPNLANRELEPGWDKYRPWQGQSYGGQLDYTWQEGKVRVIRDFAEHTVTLIDLETGQEIEGLPCNNWGEPDFARTHFGCSKLVFRNTISISQLGSATDTAVALEVRNLLSNLAQSGGSGISVKAGLQALQEARRQTDFELMKTRAMLEQVQNRLAEARGQIQEAAELEINQYQVSRQLEGLSRERRQLKELAQQVQSQAALSKLARIEDLRRELEAVQRQAAQLSAHSMDPQTFQQWTELQAEIERARELHRLHGDALAETEERMQHLQAQIDELAPYQDFDKDTLIEMSSAWQMQVKGQQVMEELESQLEGIAAEIRAITNELSHLPYFRPDTLEQAAALQAQMRRGAVQESQEDLDQDLDKEERKLEILRSVRWVLLMLLPVTGAVAYLIQPLLAALALPLLLGIFAIQGSAKKANLRCRNLRRELYTREMAYLNSQRLRDQAQRELNALLSRAGVDSIGELEEKYRRFVSLSEQNHDLVREQKYISEKLATYSRESSEKSREFTEILEKVALADLPMEQALACFRVNLDKLLDARMFMEQCRQQEEAARQRLEQSRLELEGLEERAREMMQAYSAGSAEEMEALAREYYRRQELVEEEENLRQRLTDILEGSSEAQLREQAAAASDVQVADPQDLPQRLEALDEQILSLQSRKSEGLGRLEGLYANLPSPADLEEEEWQLQGRCRELELDIQALDLAVATITELAEELNSQLAPELNLMVSSLVQRITGGKYNELQVAQDMSINVLAPERGDQVDLSRLSGGTIDQFYFACRVAIADLVTGGGLPLFLDDSFVQYDDLRLKNMLNLLVELGASRQIILLTCQRRELDMLADLAPGRYHSISLE
jgi:uncharacterized protein YhaN